MIDRENAKCWAHDPQDNQYCAIEEKVFKEICSGDAGGGLINENYEIIGVLSQSKKCLQADGDLIEFTDIYKLTDFIESRGRQNCNFVIIILFVVFVLSGAM